MAITKNPAPADADDIAAPEPTPAYDAAADIRAHRAVLTELVHRTNFHGDLGIREQLLDLLGAPSTSQD